ncbi:MAG: CHAT domain-containing protein [Aequorivita sp.]
MEILRRNIIRILFLLFCIGNSFSQQHPVDIIYSQLDDYLEKPNPERLAKLQNSIESISATDKEVQLAKTIAFCNIGYVENQNASLQKAIDSYEKAKQIYFSEDLSNYDIIEYCLKPLGNLYIKTQALSEAENTIKHYILFAKKTGQTKQEIAGILNLSVLYHNRGEFEKSKTILLQALEKEPSNQDLKLNLATSFFALNQKDETKKLINEILSSSSSNVRGYQLLAQVYLSEKDYNNAILNLQKALKIIRNHSETNVRDVSKIQLSLAETYFAAGQFAASLSELQKIYTQLIPSFKKGQQIPSKEQLYAETVLMDALDLQANILSAENKPIEALQALDLASQVNDFLFAQLYIQDSKLVAQQNVKRRNELMMELFYQQYQHTKDQEWIEKAIDLDGRSKGRVVSDAVFLKNILQAQEGNNSIKFRELQKELSFLGNEIQKETKKNNMDLEKLASLQKSYSQALTEQRLLYDKLQLEIGENYQSEISLFELKEKAARLNQILVSYFMGSENVYQIIVSEEKIAFYKLTDTKETYENFRESIRVYNRFFESPATINNDISAFTKVSNILYEKFNLPNSKNLIIIPDGILSFVPFQTLITETTDSQDYSQMPFLVFKSSVSYLLSLKDYLKEEGFQKKQSVLGVFPVFKDTPEELSYSVYEAEAIKKLFPSKMLMESDATSEMFSKESDKYSILHISSHALGGTFNEEASIQFYDHALNIEELYGLNLSADLVVLSACDTGIGKLIRGEGALSLARAFQYAGAGNVLFSLWQVNDKSTAELMTYYYQNLKKTQSRNFAIHQASLDYLQDKSIDNSRKSPYYWGAFVYYGATDLPQESLSINWYILGGGIFLILFLLILFMMNRKNI